MKKHILLFYLLIMIVSNVISQEQPKHLDYKLNTIFVQSDFFTWAGEFGLVSLTANYERLVKSGKIGYFAFAIGGGPLFGIYDYQGTYSTIDFEMDGIFGRKSNFFEIGGGVKVFNGNPVVPILIKSRIGYRLMASKRIMFRISYLLMFTPVEMGFSIGLGYRFGGNSHKN